jgi:hypothetical protein
MAQVTKTYLDLVDDWMRATYALISELYPDHDIKPSFIPKMISFLVQNQLGGTIRFALEKEGSLFDYHHKIIQELSETEAALRSHAPKVSLVYRKLSESYLAALSNSDTFKIPDWAYEIDFSAEKHERTVVRKDPNKKLPQKIFDEWRQVVNAQMEKDGLDISEHAIALDENFHVLRTYFGSMSSKQFNDEQNEPNILEVLREIKGEQNIIVARYMESTL